jgi:hypothetical protein
MRVAIRNAGVVFSAIVAAALLALTTVTSALADTALMLGGIGATVLPDMVMRQVLNGEYANDSRVNVVWPGEARPYTGSDDLTLGQSVAEGTETLYQKILTTPGPKTIVGMSAGALVVDEVLRRLADDPDAPSKEQLTFVVLADSSRQLFINRTRYNPTLDYTYQPPPETQYDVIVVTAEYDGFADFPDRPWNLVAVGNAMAGALVLHNSTFFADLDEVPDENKTVTTNSKGGITTSYLIPTERLPLVQLMPWLAPMEETLRQQVDSGYSRNDQPAVTSSTATDLTNQTEIESFTLTVDPPVGALTEPVDAPAQDEGLADATDGLAKAKPEAPANATDELTKATAEPPAQADQGLDSPAEAVSEKVTDLTDGNKASPSTTAGTTQSSSGWKQGDGIRAAARAVQRLFSGNTASTSTPTVAPTSDTSTTRGNKVVPGKAGEDQAATNSGDQATSTEDSEEPADSDG